MELAEDPLSKKKEILLRKEEILKVENNKQNKC